MINSAISVSKIAEHGSILCSAMIMSYSTWLCYSSVAALPEPVCNPHQRVDEDFEGSTEHYGMLIVSCGVAGLSCGYFAYKQGAAAIGGNDLLYRLESEVEKSMGKRTLTKNL